jgi:dienelactone hydrolase
MFERRDVEFCAESGLKLRGWLFVPEKTSGPRPAVTMAHGYAGVKEQGLERFARAFAEAGFVVLLHDHRNFGASDGAERGDVDPWQQIADWRRATSFLENLPEVDAAHIGIWGTSYAGGHAIVLGATDRRLRAVVAQVPTISASADGGGALRHGHTHRPCPGCVRARTRAEEAAVDTRRTFRPLPVVIRQGKWSSHCLVPPASRIQKEIQHE